MNKWILGIGLISTSAFSAETYQLRGTEYTASGAAKELFGYVPKQPQKNLGIDFGHIQADVSTKMDCGRIDLVTNFEAQFKKLRDQANAFITDLDGYVAAAPMMITCYTMPQVCALIRHDHFQFAQNLNLRAQACAAIDKYIDNQAEVGSRQLKAEAQQKCIEEKIGQGLDMASATESCQKVTGMPLRDLSDGLRKRFASGSQKVLAAMLNHTRESASYDFLVAMLGEIEVQTNGYWQALWPKRMLKPYEVAENFFEAAREAACRQLDAILENRAGVPRGIYEKWTHKVAKEQLTKDDALALSQLLPRDKEIACEALGRSLGALAAKQAGANQSAVMATSLNNSALTSSLRDEYANRSLRAFTALHVAIESEEVPKLGDVKNNVRELAKATLQYSRAGAARLSRAKIGNESSTTEMSECTDTASCGGR